ncbi:unnamed protein product [Protopolystoma xenopodis]|uniref:Uncharacterized protein n=1 Tax=Protopolystoma xenopodis TaxID=117903 RepID=A0A3S5AT27_9PLAT|nr:unnamed protein product [Protopolystoma xenopodis]
MPAHPKPNALPNPIRVDASTGLKPTTFVAKGRNNDPHHPRGRPRLTASIGFDGLRPSDATTASNLLVSPTDHCDSALCAPAESRYAVFNIGFNISTASASPINPQPDPNELPLDSQAHRILDLLSWPAEVYSRNCKDALQLNWPRSPARSKAHGSSPVFAAGETMPTAEWTVTTIQHLLGTFSIGRATHGRHNGTSNEEKWGFEESLVSSLLRLLPFRVRVLREEIRRSVPPEDDDGCLLLTLFPRQSPSIPVKRC